MTKQQLIKTVNDKFLFNEEEVNDKYQEVIVDVILTKHEDICILEKCRHEEATISTVSVEELLDMISTIINDLCDDDIKASALTDFENFKLQYQKGQLIIALEKEKTRLTNNGFYTHSHDIVIEYLKTGQTMYNSEDYPLLDTAINDFETLCSDYNC